MSCASLTSGSDSAIASTRSRRSRPRARGSTCTTTSLPGSAASTACLDQVGGAVALDDAPARRARSRRRRRSSGRRTRAAAGGSSSMSSPSRRSRRSAAARASAGVRSMSTLAFSAISRSAATRMIAATSERGDRVALRDARAHRQQADEHGQRAGHVAGEVERVGAQRGAVVALARRASETRRAAEVDAPARRAITANWYQWMRGARPPLTRLRDRLDAHDHAAGEQDRGLAERAQVLGAAVAVGVPADRPGRPPRRTAKNVSDGRDHVAAGLDPGGDQPEAAGREAHAQLQRDEHAPRRRSRRAWCAAAAARDRLRRRSPSVQTRPGSGWSEPRGSACRGAYRGLVAHDARRALARDRRATPTAAA